ncbi:MAG: hypothetical protein AAF675_12405 [Pseudomonadota bacterium]
MIDAVAEADPRQGEARAVEGSGQEAPLSDAAHFDLLVRLAGALAAQQRQTRTDAASLAALAGPALPEEAAGALLADPAFAPHLSTLSVTRTISDVDCRRLVSRLVDRADSRLSLLVVTSDDATIETAAKMLAAAVLQRRFLSAVTRAQREALAEAFPPEMRSLGSNEAPVLYAALGKLDHGEAGAPPGDVAALGMSVLEAFVEDREPTLLPQFTARLSRLRPSRPDGFGPVQSMLVRKLLARKVPAWRPLIS